MENVDQSHETNGTKWDQMIKRLNECKIELDAARARLADAQASERKAREDYFAAWKELQVGPGGVSNPSWGREEKLTNNERILIRMESGPVAIKDVAELIGVPNQQAGVYLSRLKELGRIVRIDSGVYALPKEAARG